MTHGNEDPAVYSLLELLPDYFQYFRNFTDLREKQLTKTQFRILLILSTYPSLSMSQLSDKLSISREQATRAVAPLANRRLVSRCAHDTNRRQLDVTLTPDGQQLLDAIKSEYRKRMHASFATLTPEEQDTLNTSIHNITAIMKKLIDTQP